MHLFGAASSTGCASYALWKISDDNNYILCMDQRAKCLKELDLDRDTPPVERALGLQWCVDTDSFGIRMETKQQLLIRRGMLSVSNCVYDPLGLLVPVTLLAEMMHRRGCVSPN